MLKSRAGLIPVKKRIKTGAMITFWVKAEKAKKARIVKPTVNTKQKMTSQKEMDRYALIVCRQGLPKTNTENIDMQFKEWLSTGK